MTSQPIRLSPNFMTLIPSLTFAELWVVSREHFQRVWYARRNAYSPYIWFRPFLGLAHALIVETIFPEWTQILRPWSQTWLSPNYERFSWGICNGCGMPAGSAYLSGHPIPSPLFGTYLCSNWRDQIYRTCRVFTRLFTLNTPRYFLDFSLSRTRSFSINEMIFEKYWMNHEWFIVNVQVQELVYLQSYKALLHLSLSHGVNSRTLTWVGCMTI